MLVPNAFFISQGVPANVSVNFELITVEDATNYLTHNNHNNRSIKRTRVDQYASSMKAGFWEFNGDTIRFDDHGNIIDGQHRLTGVVMSKQPTVFLVIRGLSGKAQATIDKGATRTASDAIAFKYGNKSDSSAIAKSIKSYLLYTNKWSISNGGRAGVKAASEMILDHYDNNKAVIDFCYDQAKKLNKVKSYLTSAQATFLYYVFYTIDSTVAHQFMSSVLLATIVPDTIEYHANTEISRKDVSEQEKMYTMINAWNYFRKGKTVKQSTIRWPTFVTKDGAKVKNNNYPVAI
jgi:hypothetical protein